MERTMPSRRSQRHALAGRGGIRAHGVDAVEGTICDLSETGCRMAFLTRRLCPEGQTGLSELLKLLAQRFHSGLEALLYPAAPAEEPIVLSAQLVRLALSIGQTEFVDIGLSFREPLTAERRDQVLGHVAPPVARAPFVGASVAPVRRGGEVESEEVHQEAEDFVAFLDAVGPGANGVHHGSLAAGRRLEGWLHSGGRDAGDAPSIRVLAETIASKSVLVRWARGARALRATASRKDPADLSGLGLAFVRHFPDPLRLEIHPPDGAGPVRGEARLGGLEVQQEGGDLLLTLALRAPLDSTTLGRLSS